MPSCEDKDFSSPLSEIDIAKADVAKRLSVLNLNKSPRQDGLKKPARELSEPLAMIFDKSLQEGIITRRLERRTSYTAF